MCRGWPGMTQRGRRAMLLAIVGQVAKGLAQISCLTPCKRHEPRWRALGFRRRLGIFSLHIAGLALN